MLPEAVGTRQPPRPAPTLATHGPGSTRQDDTAATALYGLIWLEIAFADNTCLPEHTREQISARIEQLLENPRQPRDGYDELTDQWTTTYGGGAGLIVYAVVHERQRVIILRLV